MSLRSKMKSLTKVLLGMVLFSGGTLVFLFGRISSTSLDASVMICRAGFLVAMILTMANSYFDLAYDGLSSVQRKCWPRFLFLFLISGAVAYSCVTVFVFHEVKAGIQIVRLTISAILFWHAFAVVFGTFFGGLTIATLFRDPLLLLRSRKQKDQENKTN
jgi:hypothetical protein